MRRVRRFPSNSHARLDRLMQHEREGDQIGCEARNQVEVRNINGTPHISVVVASICYGQYRNGNFLKV